VRWYFNPVLSKQYSYPYAIVILVHVAFLGAWLTSGVMKIVFQICSRFCSESIT